MLNLSGGAPTSVAVASPASHGTATASGTSISYTPTLGYFGADSFTYTATNGMGTSSPATVSITVSAPVISVTPTTLASGTVGSVYSQTLSASGGAAPYTFSPSVASGALPTGLALSSSGAITGTPTAACTCTFTVSGTDSSTATHASFTSSTISLTVAAILPGAPTIGSATPGNAQATVSFTPPASSGGGTITSYTVTSSPGGLTGSGPASPITVTGLTNGTSYTFTVTATNSAGTGPASVPSNAITPAALPVAGSSSATVAYNSNANTIPLNLSGGAPTSVAIASAASHGTATASGTSISYTPTAGFFGSDSFTYTATNGTGTSPAGTVSITISAPTITISPTTLASGTYGTPYSQSLLASGGQAPYTFATTPASGSLPAGITLASSGAITGTPTAAGTYTFTVSGTDSSTPSPAPFTSASITLTIGAILPGAPIVGTATAGNAQATVTFTPPSSLGGDAIVRHTPFQPELNGSGSTTTYTATSSPGGVTGSSTSSPILVTGLTNGTTYTFTIAATNSAGTGPSSAPTNAVTPQASQTITFANPGPQVYGSTPTVTATASSGLAVSFSSSTMGVCTVTSGGVLSFVAAGTCSLNANQSGNAAYQAAPQVSQSFNVAAVDPGQPTILGAAAGNGQSTVAFATPASNGGAPITSYTVTSSPGGITATGAASPITIGGLANGTAYTFTVTATNSAGTGPSSAPSNPVTPSANVTATQAVATTSLTQNHAATPFTPVVGGSGAAPLSYAVAPALPAGLSLAAATGTISGTPTAQSPATIYTVTVTDANGVTSAATFSLTINGPVTAAQSSAPPTLTQGVAATPFTPITGSGGTAPLTYSVSPALPAALMISSTTGQITGTPTAASAATTYTVTVTDANGATSTATFSLTVTGQLLAAAKSVTAAYNANGTTSTAIDLSSSITGGAATSVAVVTQPSHGVATASGLGVTYLPTIGFHGSDSFTYTASGGGVTSAAATVSITVSAPSISVGPAILPGGAVGVAYLQSLVPNGGEAPYLFSTTPASGTLPAGLTITSGGVLSGTPTTACVCTFTVSGTDSSVGGAVSFTSPTISLTIVAGAPTVLGVTPAIGLAAGGTVVSVSGTNFTDTSVVSFGSAPATAVTYVSPTELTATAPAGTGTVDVVVATAGGASAASVLDQFTYLAQPAALSDPVGTAVDDSGNLFIADASLGYLVEVPAGCQALNCEEVIGGGFAELTGVAVDGNGSLYALSGGANGTVTRLTWNAATSSYVAQTTIASGLVLPDSAPTGIAVDDLGNLYVTDTANHRVVEERWIAASNSYGAPVVLATGSASSAPSGIAVDGNGDVFIADPGTQTIEELTPAGLLAGAAPTILATGVNAQSITIDASGDLYYSDSVANTITKIPWSGSSYATPVVIATSLNAPEGLSVDDSGNLLVANNATKSIAKVSVDTSPSLHFANTKVGATSTDSPQVATLANIGTAALTFLATSGTNPLIPAGFALDHAATCPEVFSTSASQTLAEGASCTYAIDFSPGEANIGSDAGPLLATDDNLNLSGATQSIALSGTAIADDASSVTLTLNPASPIVFGKAIAIDAVVRDATVPATVPTGSIGFTVTNSASVESSISTPIALNGGSASVAGFTPPAVGSYTIAGNYTGVVGDIAASTGSIALTVTKATPMLSYAPSPATQAYGTGIPATALDATAVDGNGAAIPGSFVYTTTVNSVATTLAAGSTVLPAATYTITATFTPVDAADYVSGGTVSAAYSVTQKTATVTLGGLSQGYTGKPHEATAVTSPADLDVTFTYNGSAMPPVSAGSYAVVATILDTDYVGSATGTLVIAKAAPDAVTLSSSSNPVLTQNAVTFTATVASALSVPTGTVAFFDTTTGTALGSAMLANGVAMLTTSSLAVGDHSITATYQGDIDFLALASAPLAQTVLDFSVSISSTPGSSPTVTADPGGNAAYEFTLSPMGSSTFTDPVTFTVTGLPPGATYTITPSTIPAGAVATNVTLNITLPQSTAQLQHGGGGLFHVALGLLLLPLFRRVRGKGRSLLLLVAAVGALVPLTGCGTNSGFFGHQPQSYTITLTAKSGTLSHSTTVILNVP
jgi:sugar lactone lactonase YvrE